MAGLVGGKKKGATKKTKPEIPHFEMPPTEGFLDFIPAAKRHVETLNQILTTFFKDVKDRKKKNFFKRSYEKE